MLPKRRERPRMGVKEEIKREWPRHRRFVRSLECVVPGCKNTPIRFMHVRQCHTAGTAQKPFDWLGIPGCDQHHDHQHKVGHAAFDKLHGIDSLKIAAGLTAISPDKPMREYMREIGAVV